MRLIVIALCFVLSGCYCWSGQHAQEPKCVVEQTVVDCTKDALGPVIMELFADVLNGPNVNWDQVKDQIPSRLAQLGFKDAGCALADLQAAMMSKPQASRETARRVEGVRSLLDQFKAQHGVSSIKFRVVGPDGKESLQ